MERAALSWFINTQFFSRSWSLALCSRCAASLPYTSSYKQRGSGGGGGQQKGCILAKPESHCFRGLGAPAAPSPLCSETGKPVSVLAGLGGALSFPFSFPLVPLSRARGPRAGPMLGSLPETCHTGQLWPIASIQKKRHILPVAMQFYAILPAVPLSCTPTVG